MRRNFRLGVVSQEIGEKAFVLKVKTDNAGTSGTNQFTIPGVGGNYTVERCDADGNVLETLINQSGSVTLTWASSGTYIVKISEDFQRIYFNNGGDRLKLLEVQNWGEIILTSMLGAFRGCANMEVSATDVLTLPSICDRAFQSCTSMVGNSSFNSWNTDNLVDASRMFIGCKVFSQDLTDWNMSNVTSIFQMFASCDVFNGDIGGWDVGEVTDFGQAFYYCFTFNQDISTWRPAKGTDFSYLFLICQSFNQDISAWRTPLATNMIGMFQSASSFNQDLSGWCVPLIGSPPSNFDNGATAWVLPRPVWGTCP